MTAMYPAQTLIKSCTLIRTGMRPRTVRMLQYHDDCATYEVSVSPERDHNSWEVLGDRMDELAARCMYATNVLAHAGAS